MIPPAPVAQNHRRLRVAIDRQIEKTVVVEISRRRAARRPGNREIRPGFGGYVDKPGLRIAHQSQRFEIADIRLRQLDVVHHMTLRHEDVLAAVVVVVEKLGAPARVQRADSADPAGPGVVFE